MGNNLFGADIAGKLAAALASSFLPAVLIKVSEGPRDTSNPAGGKTTSETRHSCRGILDTYKDGQFKRGVTEAGATIIKEGMPVALVLGNTLPSGVVPEPQDKFEIEGNSYTITNVTRDPDGATYNMELSGG